MKNLIVLLVAASLLMAAQCNPGPKPPEPPPIVVVDAGPEPDAGGAPAVNDAGPDPLVTPGVRLACDQLAALKCAEGMNGCYRTLQHVLDTQLVVVPLDCIVGAGSKAAVRSCGSFVACP